MLTVNDLAYSYSPKREILRKVNFSIESNDILCLLGPNGTGKTTLLRCILGLNRINKGEVIINGKNLKDMPQKERAKLMAYVPQAYTLSFPYSVIEVVLMGRTAHLVNGRRPSKKDLNIAYGALESLGILHLKDRLFNEISGGERQMVLVARAIAQRAKILIMDEPTANLDYGNQVKMLKVVNELSDLGYAILMTSHFPDHAFLACNRVALLKGGEIISRGTPEEIVTSENLTSLYDTSIFVTNADVDGDVKKVCIPII